ncbi:MAG: hypothetical protein HRT61_19195 [Ekhidna sp.]|nr:hypothetical protein [Ekhidna sp.]
MQTWGTQIDLSYAVSKNLHTGFIYSRMKGNDAFDAEVTVNHYAFSLSYIFSTLNNRLKLIPQFSVGPQRFESTTAGNSEFYLNFLQARYKMVLEFGLAENFFLSSFYSYTHNLARAFPGLSIGKNLISRDLGIGLSYYID